MSATKAGTGCLAVGRPQLAAVLAVVGAEPDEAVERDQARGGPNPPNLVGCRPPGRCPQVVPVERHSSTPSGPSPLYSSRSARTAIVDSPSSSVIGVTSAIRRVPSAVPSLRHRSRSPPPMSALNRSREPTGDQVPRRRAGATPDVLDHRGAGAGAVGAPELAAMRAVVRREGQGAVERRQLLRARARQHRAGCSERASCPPALRRSSTARARSIRRRPRSTGCRPRR